MKIDTPPNPRMYESFKVSGYQHYDAIREYVDNSIDAKATICQIYAKRTDTSGRSDFLEIMDNGTGMSRDELIQAWTFGSDSIRSDNSHGTFGMGLTVSSVRLANKVKIITKKKGGGYYTLLWDFNNIKSWSVDISESNESDISYFEKRMTGLLKLKKIAISDRNQISGTQLVLSELTFNAKGSMETVNREGLHIETLRKNIQKQIGVSHCGNIRGQSPIKNSKNEIDPLWQCDIYFNNQPIDAVDPVWDLVNANLAELVWDSANHGGLMTAPNLRMQVCLLNPMDKTKRKELNPLGVSDPYPYGQEEGSDGAYGTYFLRLGRYISKPRDDRKILEYSLGATDTFLRVVLSWNKIGDSDIGLNFMKNAITLNDSQKQEIIQKIKPWRIESKKRYNQFSKPSISQSLSDQLKASDDEIAQKLNAAIQAGKIISPDYEKEKRKPNKNNNTIRLPIKNPGSRIRNPKTLQEVKPQVEFIFERYGEFGRLYCSWMSANKFVIAMNEDSKFCTTLLKDNLKNNEPLKYLLYAMAIQEYQSGIDSYGDFIESWSSQLAVIFKNMSRSEESESDEESDESDNDDLVIVNE